MKKVNLDSHSTLKNLCPWDIYFVLTGGGDIQIKANGTRDLLNREIVSLVNNSNVFFTGEDTQGSHARIYIDNPDVRAYVGFDSEDGTRKQNILTSEKCQQILNIENYEEFKKSVEEEIIAYHEKAIIMNYARKVKLNDYVKISFLEQHTGNKFII